MTTTDEPRTEPPQTDLGEFEVAAGEVDRALLAVSELDENGRAAATGLKTAIEAFHRTALVHIVQHLRDDPRGKELLFELVDDPAVRAVFSMHGIIRADPMTRARQALDDVRPYLRSHGGDVELVGIEGDEAVVRLHGSCGGCSMSAVTLREVVTDAMLTRVPEVTRVRVAEDQPTAAFIPLDSIGIKRGTGWQRACAVADVTADRPLRIDLPGKNGLDEFSLIAVQVDQRIAVFRNECPHQGRSLDAGTCIDGELRCPWHGFTFDVATGDCLSAPGAQLTQVPTKIEDGEVWVLLR